MKRFNLHGYTFRFILHIFIVLLLLPLVFSVPVSAANCGGVNTSIINCEEGGSGTITHVLRLVVDILTIGIGIVGVGGISWAGIQYLTAGASEEKAKKSKRRLFEIILGLACYVALYGVTTWVLPGNTTSELSSNNTETNGKTTSTKFKISYSGKATTAASFRPTVTFEEGAKNTTYSLVSSNVGIAKTWGSSVKCITKGKTKITAIAVDGSKATMNLTCHEVRYADDNSSSTTASRNKAGSKTAPDGSIAASDGSPTVGSQQKVKLKYEPLMRKETRQVIEAHNKDFFWYNYQSVLKKKYGGSYVKYVQSLTQKDGSDSVFSAYAKRTNKKGEIKKIKVKTAADFQAAAEYVWGLMAIWGIDYTNGGTFHHPYWGDPVSADYGNPHLALDKTAYHYGQPGRENQVDFWNYGDVNKMLKGPTILGTGCNFTIDAFRLSTTLPNIAGANNFVFTYKPKYYFKNGGVIHKASELLVGDIVHFPGHVAVVGEVYKDYIVFYDGGSKFQYNRNYKFKYPRRDNDSTIGTVYAAYRYFKGGYRVWDIDQSVTLKGLNGT